MEKLSSSGKGDVVRVGTPSSFSPWPKRPSRSSRGRGRWSGWIVADRARQPQGSALVVARRGYRSGTSNRGRPEPFLVHAGYLSEGRTYLRLSRSGVAPTVRARALDGLGWIAEPQGDYGERHIRRVSSCTEGPVTTRGSDALGDLGLWRWIGGTTSRRPRCWKKA